MSARLNAVACASILIAATMARADKPPAEARALYQKAIAHYDLAEYDAAIDEFKQAYELTHEPALLFNIAQACRLKNDYPAALHFYRTYLDRRPNASNRDDAEMQIKKLEEALKAAPPSMPRPAAPVAKPAPPPPPMPAPPSLAVAAQAAPQKRQLTTRDRAAIGIGAVGAAALIVAVGTGAKALSVRSSYDAGCQTGPCNATLYSQGRNFAVATDVLISIGVAAAVVATVVGLTHRRERHVMLGMRF